MSKPYNYPGMPPYLARAAEKNGQRDAASRARLLNPVQMGGQMISQAAHHARQGRYDFARSALDHAARHKETLQIAIEALDEAIRDCQAHLDAESPKPKPAPKPKSAPKAESEPEPEVVTVTTPEPAKKPSRKAKGADSDD